MKKYILFLFLILNVSADISIDSSSMPSAMMDISSMAGISEAMIDHVSQAEELEQMEEEEKKEEELKEAEKEIEEEEIKKKEANEEKKKKIETITEKIISEIKEELEVDSPEKIDFAKDVNIGEIKEEKKLKEEKFDKKKSAPVGAEATKNLVIGKQIPSNYKIINYNEINLGSTVPLTGGVSLVGRDFNYGINLVFNKTNRSGGVGGKTLVKFNVLDDKNKVYLSEKNMNSILDKTPLFFGVFGADPIGSFNEKLKNNEIALFFPATGDPDFRKADYKYTVHFRASLYHELAALITYAIKKRHTKKFGIFYEDSLFGEQGKILSEEILAEFGLKSHEKASYPSNTVNIMSAVKKMVAKKPNVIICISHSRPTYNFIQKVVNGGLNSCLFIGPGELVPIQNIINKSRGVELILTSVVPNPFKSDLALVKQYRKDMNKFFANRELSTFSLEGYIIASIFINTLKQVKNGANLFLDGVFNIMKQLKKINLGGIKLDFAENTKTLSDTVWINTGQDKSWPTFKLTKKLQTKFEAKFGKLKVEGPA